MQPCLAIPKSCSIKEGITTTNTGNIAISSSTKRINVLVKIPVPIVNDLTKCQTNPSLATALETFRNTSTYLINDVKSPIITPKREKRQLFAFLGATLIAALGAGFGATEMQIHSLKSHVRETRDETNLIINKLNALSKTEFEFQTATIGLIKNLNTAIKHSFDETQCKMHTIDKKIQIERYINELSKFLNLATKGQLIAKLTPDVINYEALKSIVRAGTH
jgi:hypothetical protein